MQKGEVFASFLNYQIILIQFCLALYKAFLQNLFEHNFNIKISLTIFYCIEKNQTNKHPQTIKKKDLSI